MQCFAEGLYGERNQSMSNIQVGEIVQLCLELEKRRMKLAVLIIRKIN